MVTESYGLAMSCSLADKRSSKRSEADKFDTIIRTALEVAVH
jgi:hypothetical protein